MNDSDSVRISPSKRISGCVRVPGDKSISHRAAMLSAIAAGKSTITGYLAGEDCVNTLKAVAAMGAKVEYQREKIVVIGTGGLLQAPAGVLDMGNSGTGMRLMAGLLAGQPFTAEMTGDDSLRSRPMKRIKEPLELMGAKVELLGPNGCAPVRVTGGKLHGIEYTLPVASAQVKSCVLLAGLFASGTTRVVEPKSTRDHTERMLGAAGVRVRQDGLSVEIDGSGGKPPGVKPREWVVPGDFSSAAFWMVAAACLEGGEVLVENVGLNPRRTALLDVLRRMGAGVLVECGVGADKAGEQLGNVRIKGARLRATEIGGDEIPNLIDELPVIAVAAALAEGRTVIRDAHELRVKESDRIATMARNLSMFGVKVEEMPDGMIVTGPTRVRGGAKVDSRGDHRIAMSMAVLTLFADAPATITGTACVATSYPTFWEHLRTLTDQR
ncbi:MAG: 3-phosphoshikimate 1-carboxyvinyltransferase [Verrucomicrobia bacterium]|nr:3-phosphoshikimate 1-carboxyvinyltransferase [Verrucomicrobiota bacterium]